MSEETSESRGIDERTVKAAGQIVKYSREIYHLESVEEVATMTLEATPHFIEGYPSPAVVEIHQDGLRVLESMLPEFSPGDHPGQLATRAYEQGDMLICADEEVEIGYTEGVEEVDPAGFGCGGAVTVAAPTVYSDDIGDSGAILFVRWETLDRAEQHHIKPVDYLAEHVATAIVNIRSRERLERARNDLAKRKEMIEVYDRLLRHDLGNDLQVISGFSDVLVSVLEDGGDEEEALDYARKIARTSASASELIDNVGETVKTIQQEEKPEPQHLEPLLTEVVENVDAKFEKLTVEYDSDGFEYEVYAGDLIDSVFANILSNAAVHNDGQITVRLYAEEAGPDSVVVGMADDGKGVPREVRSEIFEMGKKGPDSDGTGFGLGLARTLLESYGGTIEVRNSDRDGADFRITLERV